MSASENQQKYFQKTFWEICFEEEVISGFYLLPNLELDATSLQAVRPSCSIRPSKSVSSASVPSLISPWNSPRSPAILHPHSLCSPTSFLFPLRYFFKAKTLSREILLLNFQVRSQHPFITATIRNSGELLIFFNEATNDPAARGLASYWKILLKKKVVYSRQLG